MKPLVTLLGLLLVVACGAPYPTDLDAAPSAGPVLHTGSGTVLQAPGEGPELCLGAVAASLPPQCGGVPLVGWDWTKADGEQSLNGTTWGDYTVTGRYDVATLTVTGHTAVQRIARPADPLTTPCPEPAGGWQVLDSRRGSNAAREAALALAHSAPDHVESWLDDRRVPGRGAAPEASPIVNVGFTGDLDRHERELRAVWGGPLCITAYERSAKDLSALQADLLESAVPELRLEMLSSSVIGRRQVLGLDVVAATAQQLRAVEDRYGTGTVEVTAALTPQR